MCVCLHRKTHLLFLLWFVKEDRESLESLYALS